uniref:Uncharacterized protein n=1 Tax=Opuntia streptacantha TaxID=393608 RepID=A0A7C9EY12_OPUST
MRGLNSMIWLMCEMYNLTLDVNSMLLVFHIKASGECSDVCLSSSIKAIKGKRMEKSCRGRANINNSTLLPPQHSRKNSLSDPTYTANIHIQNTINVFPTMFMETSESSAR